MTNFNTVFRKRNRRRFWTQPTGRVTSEADIETAKSTYKNGILELVFNKKVKVKPKGKQINIE